MGVVFAWNFLWALVCLGILIYVHELGHFLFAKWMGVKVEAFAFGFGPKIVGRRIGETEYRINWIWFGGYVKMLGESAGDDPVPEADRSRSYPSKPVWQRFLITFAGGAFNLLFALPILWLLFVARGAPVPSTVVDAVQAGMPAAKAGILEGDEITAIDERPVRSFDDIRVRIHESDGRPLAVDLLREGRSLRVKLEPERVEEKVEQYGKTLKSYKIGIASTSLRYEEVGWLGAAVEAVDREVWLSGLIFRFLRDLVVGREGVDSLGSVVLIGKIAGDRAREGGWAFAEFVANMSIQLGVINLVFFLIPVVDAGQMVLLLVEAARRRPLSLKVQGIVQNVGFALLFAVMAIALYSDRELIKRAFQQPGRLPAAAGEAAPGAADPQAPAGGSGEPTPATGPAPGGP